MAPSSLHSPEEASDALNPDDVSAVEAAVLDEPAVDVPEALEADEDGEELLPEDDTPETAPIHHPLVAETLVEECVDSHLQEATPEEEAAEAEAVDDDEAAEAAEAEAVDDDEVVEAEAADDDAPEAAEDGDITITAAAIAPLPLRYFSSGGRVFLRIGPGESPEGLRTSLTAATLPDGPLWLAFEERPPTPALVDEISAVLVESIGRTPAGIRCGTETLIAGAAASMGLPVEVPPARPVEDPTRRKVMVVERTMRSGASVRFKGDVLVYGDVNAGAQIEADGNIIVLGTLRGLAHAGRSGDESALIISFDLRPTQLRIGRRIAFPPAQSRSRSPLPEVARIRDGEIVLQDFRGRLSL